MPIVSEAAIDDFNRCRKSFASTIPKNSRQYDFSDESFESGKGISYFVAYTDLFELGGWMVTKSLPECVKIEGICTHTDSRIRKGILKALVTHAVNMAFEQGKRGTVTLTNVASDEGSAYGYLGFTPTGGDGASMRLEAGNWPAPKWREVEEVPTKKGRRMWRTILETIA